MTRAKIGLFIALGVIVAALAGWLYGWSGTGPLRTELEASKLRLELMQSRMHILDARVDVFTANFGNASRNLESAKPVAQAARTRLQAQGNTELVAKLDSALQHMADAQQLASKFNQDANSRAGEASQLIDQVLQATR